MQSMKVIVCGLSVKGIIPPLHQNTQQAEGIIPPLHQNTQQANDNQGRRRIICGLPAKGMFPQLHQPPRQEVDDDEESDEEPEDDEGSDEESDNDEGSDEESDDDQGSDVEEITREQFRRAKGYLIRIEEDAEENDPEDIRGVLQYMENLTRNNAQQKRPNQEQGESSRGKAPRRD